MSLIEAAFEPRRPNGTHSLSDRHARFVEEYLIDFSPQNAAFRAGFRYKLAGAHLMQRMDVRIAIRQAQLDRSRRVQFTADHVLIAMVAQLSRLTSMLGHNVKEIYREDGSLLPVHEWPAHWGERLITEIHSEDTYDYSKDGVQAGESKTWDKSGTVTKIKRESTLAIEKQIRECLAEIGRHVNVKAWVNPNDKLADGLSDIAKAITAKLQGALGREKRMLEAVSGPVSGPVFDPVDAGPKAE